MTQQVDWHGKMTAKAAWTRGLITRDEFLAIRKAAKVETVSYKEAAKIHKKLRW